MSVVHVRSYMRNGKRVSGYVRHDADIKDILKKLSKGEHAEFGHGTKVKHVGRATAGKFKIEGGRIKHVSQTNDPSLALKEASHREKRASVQERRRAKRAAAKQGMTVKQAETVHKLKTRKRDTPDTHPSARKASGSKAKHTYQPQGRTDQASYDYTDDPALLSQKFGIDQLKDALADDGDMVMLKFDYEESVPRAAVEAALYRMGASPTPRMPSAPAFQRPSSLVSFKPETKGGRRTQRTMDLAAYGFSKGQIVETPRGRMKVAGIRKNGKISVKSLGTHGGGGAHAFRPDQLKRSTGHTTSPADVEIATDRDSLARGQIATPEGGGNDRDSLARGVMNPHGPTAPSPSSPRVMATVQRDGTVMYGSRIIGKIRSGSEVRDPAARRSGGKGKKGFYAVLPVTSEQFYFTKKQLALEFLVKRAKAQR